MKMSHHRSLGIVLRPLVTIAVAAAVLGGCADTKRQLGLEKKAPDEYAVVKRAPLDVPPSYTLRPPQPGAVRPQEGTTSDQARKVLLGEEATTTAGVGTGEASLLRLAGAERADPDIRATIDRETRALVKKSKPFVDKVLFWKDDEPFGTVIDPAKEAERLQKNREQGAPPTEGDTPTIERRRGLF